VARNIPTKLETKKRITKLREVISAERFNVHVLAYITATGKQEANLVLINRRVQVEEGVGAWAYPLSSN